MPMSDALPLPPAELQAHSQKLSERIAARAQAGFLPFSEYMEMALYEPGLGYYSAGLHKLGEAGDFVTAPELGSVFARCLAHQVSDVLRALTAPGHILEIGAGTGRLAHDLLAALDPADWPARYAILERSADLRAVQRETLSSLPQALADRVEWLESPPGDPWQGVLLANEVLDALSAEVLEWRDGQWRQLGVQASEHGFDWTDRAAPELLDAEMRRRANTDELPEGYRTEACPLMGPWVGAVTGNLVQGVALFIDYGYPRSDFYRPDRTQGTLMCHYRHHAHDDPFFWPGCQDLTAWVDFTALAEAADAHGLEVAGFTRQATFLIGAGLESVLSGMDALPDRERFELAREVRELTMPGAMGDRFRVMALSRRWDAPLSGFEIADDRGSL